MESRHAKRVLVVLAQALAVGIMYDYSYEMALCMRCCQLSTYIWHCCSWHPIVGPAAAEPGSLAPKKDWLMQKLIDKISSSSSSAASSTDLLIPFLTWLLISSAAAPHSSVLDVFAKFQLRYAHYYAGWLGAKKVYWSRFATLQFEIFTKRVLDMIALFEDKVEVTIGPTQRDLSRCGSATLSV